MIRPKKDGAAHTREDAFLGDLVPQITEQLAERRSGDFDAVAGQARFEAWLAARTKEPAAPAKGRAEPSYDVEEGLHRFGTWRMRSLTWASRLPVILILAAGALIAAISLTSPRAGNWPFEVVAVTGAAMAVLGAVKIVESIYHHRPAIIRAKGEARAALIKAKSEAEALIIQAKSQAALHGGEIGLDNPGQAPDALRLQSLDADLPTARRLTDQASFARPLPLPERKARYTAEAEAARPSDDRPATKAQAGGGGPGDIFSANSDWAAAAAIAAWLDEDRVAAAEYNEAMRADVHRRERERDMDEAVRALKDRTAIASSLRDRLDPAGRRTLRYGVGVIISVALIALDAIPLNWAAQAFGLRTADTWIITMILLGASAGAMLYGALVRPEETGHNRRLRALIAITGAVYAGLLALRTSFLVTVADESLPAGLLQALILTTISVGLVILGSAVITRTQSLAMSRAYSAVRRARRASEASRAALRYADERLQRHLAVLRRLMFRQPRYSSMPMGMAHAEWATTLDRALRTHFSAPSSEQARQSSAQTELRDTSTEAG